MNAPWLLEKLLRFARKSPRQQFVAIQYHFGQRVLPRWYIPHRGNDRTAYVIGLFGTGRVYVNELIIQNIGKRVKYFRDDIRLHPGPTSMIYGGHATIRHVSRDQALPAVRAVYWKRSDRDLPI
jgi:hypothetical protein